MHPSSSSNAEPAAGPTFKVVSRALSADLTTASVTESGRDLGTKSAVELAELLARLAALDPAQFADADPHFLVTGRRGRFTIKPGRGQLLLQAVGGQDTAYFALPVDQVPAYLDGRDPVAVPAGETTPASTAVAGGAASRGPLAFALFALAIVLVAGSAYFTFQTEDVDPVSDYEPIAAAHEVAAVRQQTAGTFATGDEPGERSLEVRADGALIYREATTGSDEADERQGMYAVVRRRADRVMILRVAGFGPIEARADGTLFYAGETYRRRGAKPGAR